MMTSPQKFRAIIHALLLVYTAILVYIVGGLIFAYQVPVEMFFALSFALLFFALGQALFEMGPMRTLVFFAITAIIGFLAEVLGTGSGFPFGRYSYGDFLGPKIFGVPEVVPLIWFVIVYICFSQSFVFFRQPGSMNSSEKDSKEGERRHWWLLALLALTSFGAMAWDVVVDPMFTSYGYWTWAQSDLDPRLYGVPLTNFVGWFAISFLMLFLIFAALRPDRHQVLIRKNTTDSRIVYVLLLIDGGVANASLGNYLAIILGGLFMVGFFLSSFWLSRKEDGLQLMVSKGTVQHRKM
jgi:uncharacterized membrane protein